MDKGISSPFVRGAQGYFKVDVGADLIKSNIAQILGTIPGERVMLPEFGCKLRNLLFEPMDTATYYLAKTYIVDAIILWEKRISLNDVELEKDEDKGIFLVSLSWIYNETGTEESSMFLVGNMGVKVNE